LPGRFIDMGRCSFRDANLKIRHYEGKPKGKRKSFKTANVQL
jgi:hypothetical protein